jgi:hypothetical protein
VGGPEGGDLGDAVPLDPQDVELEGPEHRVPRAPEVAPGGREPVDPGREGPPVALPLGPEGPVEQGAQVVLAGEHGRARRHGDPDVLGRAGQGQGGVARVVGLDEAGQQPALGLARLGGGPVGATGRQAVLHRRPGPLHGAVGGGDAGAERLGRLDRRPPEHVAGDQRRPLPRRQSLEGDQEGELDRLAVDGGVVGALFEQHVRVRLQPGHLGPVATTGRRLRRRIWSRQTFVHTR